MKHETYHFYDVCRILTRLGFNAWEEKVDGMYQKVGESVHVFTGNGKVQVVLDFFESTLENIFVHYNNRIQEIEKYTFFARWNMDARKHAPCFSPYIQEWLKQSFMIFDVCDIKPGYDVLENLSLQGIAFELLKTSKHPQIFLWGELLSLQNMQELWLFLKERVGKKRILIYTQYEQTVKDYLVSKHWEEDIAVFYSSLHFLESYETIKECVLCDDIIGKVFVKKRVYSAAKENMDTLISFSPWDYVVHKEHGIGKLYQIVKREHGNIVGEFFEIHYANNDKLFVPILEVNRLTKYIGKEHPELDALGKWSSWKRKVIKAQEDIQKVAQELITIYATRRIAKGTSFVVDREKIESFQKAFPYEYTDDQLKAIEEILFDMQQETLMDRLLVGDVWFWKTEVAFHAIYVAFLNKRLALLIAPLVVLAYELYEKACERLAPFWLNIRIVTRGTSDASLQTLKQEVKEGKVDLIVGTHRLFYIKEIYEYVWLLVLDEEHKFWVRDKEKIKELQGTMHVLWMSATPIPRTLQLSLSGIRSISLLLEPPKTRKQIISHLALWDERLIYEACKYEFQRGGQVFFIHNRVQTIERVYHQLVSLFWEEVRILIVHGRLSEKEIEKRIIAFKNKEYHILLATTVIENGIDFSHVNTLFIHDAHTFSIGQLHQLRGRIGRRDIQGYCYFLVPQEYFFKEHAKKVSLLVENSYLGAWFELALHDLETRGYGDILWFRQSGSISDVGVSLYFKMLEEKIEELSEHHTSETKHANKKLVPQIELQISAYLPDSYFYGDRDKIEFYKQMQYIDDMDAIEEIFCDLQKEHVYSQKEKNFFSLIKLRKYAMDACIVFIGKNKWNYEIVFDEREAFQTIIRFLENDTHVYFQVKNGNTLVARGNVFKTDEDFLYYILPILQAL